MRTPGTGPATGSTPLPLPTSWRCATGSSPAPRPTSSSTAWSTWSARCASTPNRAIDERGAICDSEQWRRDARAGWGQPGPCNEMSLLSRWRKGLSANADVALPPAGSAPLPVPGIDRMPRRGRRLSPQRVVLGGIRTVLRLGTAVIIVVVVAVVAVSTAVITYVFLPLPVNLPEERPQPEAMASTVFALDGTPIGQFKGAESQVQVSAADIPDTIRRAVVAAEDHRFFKHRCVDSQAIGRALHADVAA